jgi:hypothetical protein
MKNMIRADDKLMNNPDDTNTDVRGRQMLTYIMV